MIKTYLVHGRDRYRIEFRTQANGAIAMTILERPTDPYHRCSVSAHILSGNRLCVAAGKEPRTLQRAEAIAQFWAHGYSAFIRHPSGAFNNSACRVDV